MNILVTGGAGFIGSHLSEFLVQQEQNQVFCIDNFNDFYHPEIKRNNIKSLIDKANYTLFEADITDYSALEKIFNQYSFDVIVHLAAMAGVRPSIQMPMYYTSVNINGTQHLLEMAKEFNVRHFVFGSSSSVYGENEKVPFAEEDFVDHPISPYAATKKAGELLCHTYHRLFKLNIACLRFFTVYGPRQRPDLAIHKFTRLIEEGNPIPVFGDGSTKRDYTFVEDIIDGTTKTIKWLENQDEPRFEVYNLGESETIELSRLIELIEKSLDKKAIIDRQPMQAGDVPRTYADISRAVKYLDYSPKTKIEQGIPKFASWFKENIEFIQSLG